MAALVVVTRLHCQGRRRGVLAKSFDFSDFTFVKIGALTNILFSACLLKRWGLFVDDASSGSRIDAALPATDRAAEVVRGGTERQLVQRAVAMIRTVLHCIAGV